MCCAVLACLAGWQECGCAHVRLLTPRTQRADAEGNKQLLNGLGLLSWSCLAHAGAAQIVEQFFYDGNYINADSLFVVMCRDIVP